MSNTSRKYNKRVEIWRVNLIDDGYGGQKPDPNGDTLLTTSWMELNTNLGRRFTDLGITDILKSIEFKTRYNPNISIDTVTDYFKYRGNKYVLQAVDNTGLMDNELIFVGTAE